MEKCSSERRIKHQILKVLGLTSSSFSIAKFGGGGWGERGKSELIGREKRKSCRSMSQ